MGMTRGRQQLPPVPPPPVPPTPVPTPEQRLAHLVDLRHRGLISYSEYEETRRRILGAT
jgi:hypothetical protein